MDGRVRKSEWRSRRDGAMRMDREDLVQYIYILFF